MRTGLFWGSVGMIVYTYAVFPIILVLRGILAPREVRLRPITPTVSLIVAARNEELAIADKLRTIDELEYPADRLQVVIASDGSDDRTGEIVETHAGRRITLLRLPRQGKAPALNCAVEAASGEILVFTDANSRLAPDAIQRLVAPFDDPAVGGVAGNQVYDPGTNRAKTDGERAYWSFDRLLKLAESRGGNTISATGALYAIRRELFDPIPDGVTDDFFASVGVIVKGRRLLFEPTAIAYEQPSRSGRLEFRRKVRIMTRGLAAIRARRLLLDPRVHGFYAVQLVSHKILRRLMGLPMLVTAIIAPTLWRRGAIYRIASAGQALFYGCALIGLVPWRGARLPIFSIPSFVCSATVASLFAIWNTLRGHRIDRWEPDSREAADETPIGR